MKQLLTSILLSASFLANAQDQILNGGFETWTQDFFSSQTPDSWLDGDEDCVQIDLTTYECQEATEKSSDANTGNFAARIQNYIDPDQEHHIGTLIYYNTTTLEPHPFTSRPTKLKGYFKLFKAVSTDQVKITLSLIDANGTGIVGYKEYTFSTAAATYTAFEMPIQYFNSNTPADINLMFQFNNGASVDSYFILDDLTFEYSGTVENFNPVNSGIKFYPNPSEGRIQFESPVHSIIISSIEGMPILTHPQETSDLQLESLKSGIYHISYEHQGQLVNSKLVIR